MHILCVYFFLTLFPCLSLPVCLSLTESSAAEEKEEPSEGNDALDTVGHLNKVKDLNMWK